MNDEELLRHLTALHPKPSNLPPLGGERIVQTSALFAEIVLVHALARGKLGTPEQIREAARAATLWYFGVQPPPGDGT
jgi:hypothetical protein